MAVTSSLFREFWCDSIHGLASRFLTFIVTALQSDCVWHRLCDTCKLLTLRRVSWSRVSTYTRSMVDDGANHMKIGLIFRLLVTILRYPAPTFCEHWGYWVQPDRLRKAEARWLWRADVQQ